MARSTLLLLLTVFAVCGLARAHPKKGHGHPPPQHHPHQYPPHEPPHYYPDAWHHYDAYPPVDEACPFDSLAESVAFAIQRAGRTDLGDFVRLLRTADLGAGVNARSKLTIFAPRDDDVEDFAENELGGDVDDLVAADGLRNRMIRTTITNSGHIKLQAFNNNQELQTLDPETRLTALVADNNGVRTVRIRGPRNTVTISNTQGENNIHACKVVIHVVSDVIAPRDI